MTVTSLNLGYLSERIFQDGRVLDMLCRLDGELKIIQFDQDMYRSKDSVMNALTALI